ncbi:hypothetical protein LissoIVSPER_00005 [Lissonota sp. PSUC_FEM 10030012]|nr:hypothetical protein [Lissonota sp. PSUC_FEM 10030012]
MGSDSDVQVHIRNELRMCRIDCRKCKFVCVHVCSGSLATKRDVDLRQIRYDFRKPFKCKVCNFVVEHRECQTFRFNKNSVIEFRCERCNFVCNHTCYSAYDQHEVTGEGIKNEANAMWYLRIVCGNTMSSFKHTCGMKQVTWADECPKQKFTDQSPSESSSLCRGRFMDHNHDHFSCNIFEYHRKHNDTEEPYRRRSIGQTSRATNEDNYRYHRHYNRDADDNYCSKRVSWKCRMHHRRIERLNDPIEPSQPEHDHCCCTRPHPSPSAVSQRRARRD